MTRLKPLIPHMQVAFSESVCLHPNEFNIGSVLKIEGEPMQHLVDTNDFTERQLQQIMNDAQAF